MADYLPGPIDARYAWFDNLNTVLKTIGPQLGLPQATTDGYQAGYQVAAAKKQAVKDVKKAHELAVADFDDYEKGFLEVTRKLVKTLKNANGWNDGLAKTTGTYITPVVLDLVNAQPVPKIKIVTGQPHVDFAKHGFDGVNIERKINNGEFAFLASPQFSPFIDTDPLQVAGVAEIRYYQLTFTKGDQEAGIASAIIWVAFAG